MPEEKGESGDVVLGEKEIEAITKASALLNQVHHELFKFFNALDGVDEVTYPKELVSLKTSCEMILEIRRGVSESEMLTEDNIADLLGIGETTFDELLDLAIKINALAVKGRHGERHDALTKLNSAKLWLGEMFKTLESKIPILEVDDSPGNSRTR